VFTRNERRGLQFAMGLQVGMTHINDMTVADHAHTAWGGEKNSGLGRFNGEWVIEKFTRDQWITIQHGPKQFPF
jgi:aldehyde dehydrogenase (NAD+)